MMIPWQAAKKWWNEHSPVKFEVVLGEYLKDGLVHSDDKSFVLAKETLWESETMYTGDIKPNCWFCHLGAGDWKSCLKLAPRKLQYVAWQRGGDGPYHVYEFDKLLRRIK